MADNKKKRSPSLFANITAGGLAGGAATGALAFNKSYRTNGPLINTYQNLVNEYTNQGLENQEKTLKAYEDLLRNSSRGSRLDTPSVSILDPAGYSIERHSNDPSIKDKALAYSKAKKEMEKSFEVANEYNSDANLLKDEIATDTIKGVGAGALGGITIGLGAYAAKKLLQKRREAKAAKANA